MKIKKSEILRLMNDIVENMPLCLSNVDDARDIWPARWNELYDQIESFPYGSGINPPPCMFCGGVTHHKSSCKFRKK